MFEINCYKNFLLYHYFSHGFSGAFLTQFPGVPYWSKNGDESFVREFFVDVLRDQSIWTKFVNNKKQIISSNGKSFCSMNTVIFFF